MGTMIELLNRPCSCVTCEWLRAIAAAADVPSLLWDSGGGCIILILSADPRAVLQGMDEETGVPPFVAVDSECNMGGFRTLAEWDGSEESAYLAAHDGEDYPPASEYASAATEFLTAPLERGKE